ncbi:MAG: hypothetical protein NDI69_05485 [Bacteriovoracaceae bacterium]|nr:hypothetical protein [Bacteriovoracaceae bacterium]
MNKVKFLLVKYDMTKTKSRKRKDMLVDNQSNHAVFNQLERIHKGEKVVKIHEIVWDENQVQAADYFSGVVKFFDRYLGKPGPHW